MDSLIKKIVYPVEGVEKQFFNNSLLARNLFSGQTFELENRAVEIETSIQIRKEILHPVIFMRSRTQAYLVVKLEMFDLFVMDAIYSLSEADVLYTTDLNVAKILCGNFRITNRSNLVMKVRESIAKMMDVQIRINAEPIFSFFEGLKENASIPLESALCPLEPVNVFYACNGKSCEGYHIVALSALYVYADIVKRLVPFPTKYLFTQKHFCDTKEAVKVKRYVIRDVLTKLHDNNKLSSNKISLSWKKKTPSGPVKAGLCSALEINDQSKGWRTKRKPRLLKEVKGTLLVLQYNGVIQSFQQYRLHNTTNRNSPVMGFELKWAHKNNRDTAVT